jgi:hypothetical protein
MESDLLRSPAVGGEIRVPGRISAEAKGIFSMGEGGLIGMMDARSSRSEVRAVVTITKRNEHFFLPPRE